MTDDHEPVIFVPADYPRLHELKALAAAHEHSVSTSPFIHGNRALIISGQVFEISNGLDFRIESPVDDHYPPSFPWRLSPRIAPTGT